MIHKVHIFQRKINTFGCVCQITPITESSKSHTKTVVTNIVFCLFQVKCEQYWPESTSRFGAINVTLLKTETFADYVIRTIVLVKVGECKVNDLLYVYFEKQYKYFIVHAEGFALCLIPHMFRHTECNPPNLSVISTLRRASSL